MNQSTCNWGGTCQTELKTIYSKAQLNQGETLQFLITCTQFSGGSTVFVVLRDAEKRLSELHLKIQSGGKNTHRYP